MGLNQQNLNTQTNLMNQIKDINNNNRKQSDDV